MHGRPGSTPRRGSSSTATSSYVADTGNHALRRVDLEDGQVETLVGTGLFDFGDEDGPFARAKLQHVLGVAVHNEGSVLIADTYNHEVKRLDLTER